VIPVEFTWSDLGSWKALDEFLKPDPGENTFRGEVCAVDSSGCLVYGSKRLIALVGVKDLVVVDTEDAILVLNKDRAQEVRTVVGLLEKEGK
jgi:mannose-1-phosphate guanylyltransferase